MIRRRLTDRQRKAMFAKRSASIRGLVTRGKRGEALLAKHEGLVQRIAKKFARSHPTAQLDDLLQEGRLGLLRAGKLYKKQTGATFATYAHHHIAKRMRELARKSHLIPVAKGKLKKGGKVRFNPAIQGEAGEYHLSQRADSDAGGLDRLEAKLTVRSLMKRLPKPEHDVLQLRHFNGHLTHRAIAKKLKKSVGTIHKLEKQAMARMRRASLRAK